MKMCCPNTLRSLPDECSTIRFGRLAARAGCKCCVSAGPRSRAMPFEHWRVIGVLLVAVRNAFQKVADVSFQQLIKQLGGGRAVVAVQIEIEP